MDTSKLKRFAQEARRLLIEQVTLKLNIVLQPESRARRESAKAVTELEKVIADQGKDAVIDNVAYTWFNRFCALRFMDMQGYNPIRVVSPADESQFQPEVLMQAKLGDMDDRMVSPTIQREVTQLLNGVSSSRDPQGEAYRLLIVAVCNRWHSTMPFLFQWIQDYTELLMPDDLLSGNSVLALMREAMTPAVCEDVEVIGWLYQFYVSEKKEAIFEGLKRNQKIMPQDIPAATQLFTPHWIVRYLVENSLGRLWMLNHPDSLLAQKMPYYIPLEEKEAQALRENKQFLKIAKAEDIKICDPACGSGHMLTYAFDLLYAIYEEEGVNPKEIPSKILTHNLYGIEIDERAGELAAFALVMKARAKQRRFFELETKVKPNICVLKNVSFTGEELNEYMQFVGQDLLTTPLRTLLTQFEEADNFGALIRPATEDVDELIETLQLKEVSSQLFIQETHQKVLQVLKYADYLRGKYHVVIANPPYMGGKGMNGRLGKWLKDNYPDSKSDLFAAFIERGLEFVKDDGYSAMVTMQSWMFLSSFEKLRGKLLTQNTISSMAHLGARAFDSIGGEVVSTTAFVLEKASLPEHKGSYLRLVNENSEAAKENAICTAIQNPQCGWFFRASAKDFGKIPGSPIAYNMSYKIFELFSSCEQLIDNGDLCSGVQTGSNERFLRYWFEVRKKGIFYDTNEKYTSYRWLFHRKGGEYRKWYGNIEYVIDWDNDGVEIRNFSSARPQNIDKWFNEGVTWSHTSSGSYSARLLRNMETFNVEGPSAFTNSPIQLLGYLCSKVAFHLLEILSPTLHFLVGTVSRLPYKNNIGNDFIINKLNQISKHDWDSYETSWDFTTLPLLDAQYRGKTLAETYANLRTHWRNMTQEMQTLEEENNRIFIDAYGLQGELTPDVPLEEITLTCNPAYRYDKNKTQEELESLLLADTMREFISYAVGCMFGRYALEKPGLILANQGESLADYQAQIPQASFPADKDNVIPILEGEWFADDIVNRFRQFLKITFGEVHYEENLRFIEQALNIKGKREYKIRDYFLKEFYDDHVRRYKKRPIYWLFSSPKGSFNALIYMHRYRPDTVSVVLNNYLREFTAKLQAHRQQLTLIQDSESASTVDKTRATKQIEVIRKIMRELEDYEREILYPLATEKVEIDLDDGVKVNYQKLGKALKKITGLEAKDD